MKHVVIIGNGVAGITAARHIRKRSDCKITVVSSEYPHFFSRTALMYVYMGHMKFEHIKPYEDWFWKKNRIDLMLDHALSIDTDRRIVTLRSEQRLSYDTLVLATGSRSIVLDVPGKHLAGVQALYSYQDLQSMEAGTRDIDSAVVIGGGLIGVEMAEMLHSRKIRTTMIVREPAFWNNVLPIEEATMISNHIASHGIQLLHETEVKEILSDDHGKVRAVKTSSGEEIRCQFVGIAVGVQPNIAWLQDSAVRINRGILVNEFLKTNITDVYAVGDCVERAEALEGRKSIEQVWYTARMMGETVAQTICGNPTRYLPGPWFNSAKFFDIEFQSYGNIGNATGHDEDDFYWEHSSGRKAVHVVWNKNTGTFSGINAFGIRLRHEFFDRWLREQRTIDFVMRHLSEANFDPEFSRHHEDEIAARFLADKPSFKQDLCAS